MTEYLRSTRKLIKVRVYLWFKIGGVSFTQEAELLNILIPVHYVKPSGKTFNKTNPARTLLCSSQLPEL